MTKKGFTLIELLVVVAIIGILASVVLASLTSARDKGKIAAGQQQSASIYHSIGDAILTQLDFDDCSGASALDSSGLGNNGILQNAVSWNTSTVTGKGCAGSFDGNAGYVQVATNPSLPYTGGNLTMAAWIYPNTGETDGGHIFSKPWNSAGNYNYRFIYNGNGTLHADLSGTSGWSMDTTQTVPKNMWTYVVMTLDSNAAVKIYANGVQLLSATNTVPSWVAGNGLDLCVGTLYPYGSGWGGNTGFSFNGRIDEARIYTRTLTSMEIEKNFLAEAPAHGIKLADMK